jgi:hypothetical protein
MVLGRVQISTMGVRGLIEWKYPSKTETWDNWAPENWLERIK